MLCFASYPLLGVLMLCFASYPLLGVLMLCFASLRLCGKPQTVDVSRYSPQTRRSVLLISPTVAYDSTHSRILGNRFSVVAAARSSSANLVSTACASRRARN